ncbi:hypothetical protein Syn7502_01684 [Synechococcus sp. PCC 7502]|uniref:cupin domain-containing protein n=1 Tax=Synechococcus sp. PCC 7502 TaxID=1173263 RepID=UPI00029FDCA4|nr:cupin domain-containing protein [Synechococcus sp. PCC 7502]AFY73738.1 hypothetical protein Syn7502_01684 [Synechococcus sp. PCC 7502]
MKKYFKWLINSIITFTVGLAFLMVFIQFLPLPQLDSVEATEISTIKTLASFPTPKLQNPELILGPAGEIFEFSTCNQGSLGFTIANAQIPAGAGPLPHIHHYTNEWFWTPQGNIELFQSANEYPDLNKPATNDHESGRTIVYTFDTKPNQVVYGPKYHVHGFVNTSNKTNPLTFVWIRDQTSPKYPFDDGGIREYFQDVGIPIKDVNNLPAITDLAKEKFVTHAPTYGINQSNYFLKYVSAVSSQPPAALANLSNDQDLNKIIDAINAYNQGDQSVKCF